MDDLVDAVLALEWAMFSRVKAEGRPACQNAPDNFRAIRGSLFETWTEPMLRSYRGDLLEAQAQARNLLTEKYARMDDRIPPLNANPLIGEILAIELGWQQDLEARFPALARTCCRRTDSTGDGREFAVYLRSELETYGDETLRLYHGNLLSAVAEGRNFAVEALAKLVSKAGYADPAQAETVLASLAARRDDPRARS